MPRFWERMLPAAAAAYRLAPALTPAVAAGPAAEPASENWESQPPPGRGEPDSPPEDPSEVETMLYGLWAGAQHTAWRPSREALLRAEHRQLGPGTPRQKPM